MIKNIIKLRIILWHILALFVLFFIYKAIVPSGHISYVYDFKKNNSFISKISPKERVDKIKDGSQRVIGEPIYFSLETPRSFNEAEINIKYRNNNPEKNPIIEAGFLVDKTIWRYKLKPLSNNFLNNLYNEWDFLENDGLVLFSEKDRASSSFKSLNEFLLNPPASNEIASYNYDLNIGYILNNYSSSSELMKFNTELRGNYQILTYIKNENLYFKFTFQDLNRNADSDEININLYYRNQLIDTRHLDDDGIINNDANNKESQLRTLTFDLANMPEGAYKLELRVGDDIVTKKIETKQNKLSFLNKLWIADQQIKNFAVFTDSNIFHLRTRNPASLQDVSFASSSLALVETYKQYSANLNATSSKIIFEKGDIVLAGNGVFSFALNSLINPSIKKIDSSFNLDKFGIKYILARYNKPTLDGNYFNKTIKFNLEEAYRENSKYSFLISIPGLKLEDNIDDSIEISEIKIDLYGIGLIEKIKSLFK